GHNIACVASSVSILSSDSMASALIDEESHSWKPDLIQRVFLAHEARIIMGIPLSIHNSPNVQVPHKIKHLLWMAANDAIPTLYNLWRRRVVQAVVCPGCFSDCEETIHALWSCPVLRSIWEADELTKKFLKFKFSSFADLLDMFFSFKESTDLNLLAVLFWSIWEKRNSDRVGGCWSSLLDLRSRALRFLRNFANAQTPTCHQHSPIPAQLV
ncbi:hypothetical protein SO802_006900, partial [Lithocarpus litseifolius]